MSIRIYFLLGVGSAVLKLHFWEVLTLIAGYAVCDFIDQFLLKKRMRKRLTDGVDHEIYGWETDQDDPTSESKGDFSRVKLTQENQILFARVTDVMRSVIFTATK
jgi:hypothetical protein